MQLRLRAERLLRRPPRRVDLLVGRREVRDAEPADFDGAPVRAAEEDVSRAQLAMKYLKFGEKKQCTELRKSLCTWFGEVCSCCCLPLLPQLACNILATTYKYYFRAQ